MKELLDFFQGFNPQTLIGMAILLWYFTKHIDAKIDDISKENKVQATRTDKLYEMFIDLLKSKQ